MAEDFRIAQPKQYQRLFLKDCIRPDGRASTGCRDVKLHVRTVRSALGSAMVCYGNTRVIAGIKGKLAEPTINNPSWGYLVPNVTLPSLCNTKYRPGAPSERAVALSHRLAALTTDMVDLSELCITPGKVVWSLHLDVVCVCDDGNVWDAVVLAAVAALNTTLLPATDVQEETGRVSVDLSRDSTPLPLKFLPVSVTLSVFDGETLPDPTESEEDIESGSLTCCIDQDSHIRALWASATLSDDVISASLLYAEKRAKTLQSVIEKVSQKTNS